MTDDKLLVWRQTSGTYTAVYAPTMGTSETFLVFKSTLGSWRIYRYVTNLGFRYVSYRDTLGGAMGACEALARGATRESVRDAEQTG